MTKIKMCDNEKELVLMLFWHTNACKSSCFYLYSTFHSPFQNFKATLQEIMPLHLQP